ncbi:O-antigen ligase family protein [Rhizobium binxianense]
MSYARQLITAMLPKGRELATSLDRNNGISVFLFAILPGLSPNGNSIILNISMAWAIYSLIANRFSFRLSKADRLVAACVSLYPLAMMFGVAVNPRPLDGLNWAIRALPFFSVWLILPRMRQSPDGRLLPIFILGSGIGMIASFLVSLVQVLFLIPRAEGGATNAALFGLISVLFSGIALLNLRSPNATERLIAILGYAAGIGCVLLSGTRSAWLVIPVHLVVFLWYFRRCDLHFSARKFIIGGAVLVLGLLVLASPKIFIRLDALQQDLTTLEQGADELTSLSARIALYRGALSAIEKDPLTGYGPQNRMPSVLAEIPGGIREKLSYSHTHNGFLTAAVDAGVLGAIAVLAMLCAPIIAAWQKEPGPGRDITLVLALLLTSSYLIMGSVGLMFGQKTLDAVFAFTVALICADRGSTPISPVVDDRQK